MKKNRILGVLCVLGGAVCWGFSGCCAQLLFGMNMDAQWLTAARLLVGGLILSVISFCTNRTAFVSIWKDKWDVLQLIAFGIFGLMLCQYSSMVAISHTSAATTTVIQYCGPVLVMLVVCFRDRRLPGVKEFIALLLAVTGTFLVATHGNVHTLVLSAEGLIWCIITALTVVTYTLVPSRILPKWGSITVTGFGMIVGGIVLSLVFRVWTIQIDMNLPIFLGISGVVLFGTVASFTLYLKGVSFIGPVKASIIASVEPVASVVISFIWLKTSFMAVDLLGFACILTTVFLLARREKSVDAVEAEKTEIHIDNL